MLDIKFIRENKDVVQAGAQKKHISINIGELLILDDRRKELLTSIEKKRSEQNATSQKIVSTQDLEQKSILVESMRELKEMLQKEEEELKEVMKQWQSLMVQVPNIPDMSVPDGDDDTANKEIRTWGVIPQFSFVPKNHIELMQDLDMADFERGSKVAGFRGYFLKNDGALLSFAIWQFVIERMLASGEFSPMLVPSLVKREAFMGTGYLPQGEEDLYKTQDGDYLAGTGEVATMSYYMDEVLDKAQLPIKVLAFSPCFRREAGSHGKDVKGLYRVHEFFKFEQVVLCEASHEESVTHHEALTANAEALLQALHLPYRVVVNCGGDLGLGQVKKYDIEVWRGGQDAYGETHSSSYFHDFQSRRLNIRYKDNDGKLRFVHSLNNTALATPRVLISIIENNQQEDGSIKIPEALQKYMGKSVITRPEA